MKLSDTLLGKLGIGLNEATLVGLEVDPSTRTAAVSLTVFSLPEEGPPPDDPTIQFLLLPVGRVVASLRLGRWDDLDAVIVPVALEDLSDVVSSFNQQPIYGWQFFDRQEVELPKIGNRVSMDWRSGEGGATHSLFLFQEGNERHIDLIIWFDDMTIRDPEGRVVSIDAFAAAGKRWWDGLYAGDPRTKGCGIVPLKDDRQKPKAE